MTGQSDFNAGARNACGKGKDVGDTVAGLTRARDIHEGIAQQAQRHDAQDATGDQADVVADNPQEVPMKAPVTDSADAKIVDHFVLTDSGSGLVLAQQHYRIKLDDGQLIEGISNEHGETSLVLAERMQAAEIYVLRKDGSVMAMYRPMLTRTTDTAFKSQGSDQA